MIAPGSPCTAFLDQLDAELWLARRLGERGARIFDGDRTPEQRRDLFRAAILDNGLASKPCGRKAGRPQTFGAVFARLFGVPL